MKPESGPEPAPRAGHSAAIHGNWMYVLGGKGEENTKFNDFWKFDLERKVWEEIRVDDELTVPVARSGHSAVVYIDYIIMFGGIFEITRELNDVHVFDIKRNHWVVLFAEK